MVNIRSDSSVELVDFMGGDNSVAMSAWISFGNDKEERLNDQKRVRGLVNFLMRERHMTPFESSVFTFRIETPIFVVRELMRHRAQSANEWSGRYSKMLPSFYSPDADRPFIQHGKAGQYNFVHGTTEQHDLVSDTQMRLYQQSWDAYEQLLEAGIAKEVARMHLPLAMYSQLYVTINARNLLHFIGLRADKQALYEIQEVARGMEEVIKEKMPYTYTAWKEYHG